MIKMLGPMLGLQRYLRSKIILSRLPFGSTVLIHVGKCGGRTIRNGLKYAKKNLVDYEVHVAKPVFRKDLKYIIVARCPIARLDSAFRWRYKIVVEGGHQKARFAGEYEVLSKYKNLNSIAELLYDESGVVNKAAQQEIRKIHHIHEDISYYLTELLSKCQPSQVIAVLMQENLDEDILRVFGYQNVLEVHRNPVSDCDQGLTQLGVRNLMRFFHKDYEALLRLYCWGKIDPEVFRKVL